MLQKYYESKGITDEVRARWEHRSLRPQPEFRSTLRQSESFSDSRGLKVYRSKTLRGIWATAPYLHNGSVPTIYDLLLPAAQRPKNFTVGTREYDPVETGIRAERTDAAGHAANHDRYLAARQLEHRPRMVVLPALTEADRYNLIEFLKTFWLPNDQDYEFDAPPTMPAEVRAPYALEPPPPVQQYRPQ